MSRLREATDRYEGAVGAGGELVAWRRVGEAAWHDPPGPPELERAARRPLAVVVPLAAPVDVDRGHRRVEGLRAKLRGASG